MPYATLSELRLVLCPDGIDEAGTTPASLDDATLLGTIVEASDEVDVRLGARYSTPFGAPLPPVVVDITNSIAAYLAALIFYGTSELAPTNPLALRYARSMALLKDLSTGIAILPAPLPAAGPEGQVVVANPTSGPLFVPEDFALVRVGARVDVSGWGTERGRW